jgi:ribose-phosphate pyrophosphokinase
VAKAAEALRKAGATHISVVCLHGLFVGNALERLSGCDELACSDTVEGPHTKFSVGPEIAATLRALDREAF